MSDRYVVRPTDDGSLTLYDKVFDSTFHSSHGAVQESNHVFIDAGLRPLLSRKSLSILEMGFGTGLNALLSLVAADGSSQVRYTSVEKYPISEVLATQLAYPAFLDRPQLASTFGAMHSLKDGTQQFDDFILHRVHADLTQAELKGPYDLVYYDAFGPGAQPELWNMEALKKVSRELREGSVLVTYCAQGQFKRNLRALGFNVESLPGPPGKREIVRATLDSGPQI